MNKDKKCDSLKVIKMQIANNTCSTSGSYK